MTADETQLLAGRYQLTHLLGQGGMGAVWRAHDTQLARDVAVKELRLPGHLGEAERANWIARLDREARAAAGLKHPGIITVHDRVAGADGLPWIVMELVTGGSLADLVEARGPLPPEEVAEIGQQVAAALDAAHRRGITHRDIKPANILLEEGRAVLTDFGIAAVEGDATLTATGMIMGTPAFMAPEQVLGLPATAESDLWSLGATLYAAVEGRAPFAGTTPSAVLVAVATEEPAPAGRAGPLAPALAGLLHKDPAQRLTLDGLRARLAQPVTVQAQVQAQPQVQAQVRPQMQAQAQAPLGVPQHAPSPVPQPAPSPVPQNGASSAPQQAPRHTPQPRTVTAMTPPPPASPAARPRWSTRRKVLGAVAVLAVVAASVTGYLVLNSDALSSAYQGNLRTAASAGSPDGFLRESETRVSDDRARITHTAPCGSYAECGTRADVAQRWLAALPGVAATGVTLGSACLTSAEGCAFRMVPAPRQNQRGVRSASLRLEVTAGTARHPLSGRYRLDVTFGE
ncbi:protein kinase [Streptomyces sp. NPDC087440]|uniref:serine/threonine-protein kinase n=1 Tax=Streptomyces sp. NPDC087440 TaxID=3365790 RepID=UPI00380210B3